MTMDLLRPSANRPGSLGTASAVGHGELYSGEGGLLAMLQRLDFIGQLLRGVLPKVPHVGRLVDLPTASAEWQYAVGIVSTGTAPDVLYACLLTDDAPVTYAWVDISTAYVPPAVIPGLALVGSADTESSAITSTSVVDILTVSGLNIATTKYVKIQAQYRKTAGAAANASLGLKVNSTQVQAPAVLTAATNAADNGLLEITLGPRETNYLGGAMGLFGSPLAFGNGYYSFAQTANLPAAAITSVTLTGLVGSASISLFAKNLRIYTFP